MNKTKNEIKERLLREFTICDRHTWRIKEALNELSELFPLQPDIYANLSSEKVRCIDQFIFRFSKLQDAMGVERSNALLLRDFISTLIFFPLYTAVALP